MKTRDPLDPSPASRIGWPSPPPAMLRGVLRLQRHTRDVDTDVYNSLVRGFASSLRPRHLASAITDSRPYWPICSFDQIVAAIPEERP